MTGVQTSQFDLREKLLTYGPQSLSDIELLAVFINSDNKTNSCMQLACDLLIHLGDLRAILNADTQSFNQIQGLGKFSMSNYKRLRKYADEVILFRSKRKLKLLTANKHMPI